MSSEQLSYRLRTLADMLEDNRLTESQIQRLLDVTAEFVESDVDSVYIMKCMFLGWYIMENMKLKMI